MTTGRKLFPALLILLLALILPSGGALAQPLRAVIFYQAQTWLQEFNIMQQIAQSIDASLADHPGVALSGYGMPSMSTEDAVNAAIAMRSDVMLYYGLASDSALALYQKLTDNGVRLILVDGDVPESNRFAYIGSDNHAAGIQTAEYIVDQLGKDASIAMVTPILSTSLRSVGARLDGFEAAAQETGLNIVARCETSYDSLTAITRIEQLLDTTPGIDALFCAEAVSGQAAADVLTERGLEDEILVITFDTNPNIVKKLKTGAIDVTLTQDIENIGKACADMLIALAEDPSLSKGTDALFPCIPIAAGDL